MLFQFRLREKAEVLQGFISFKISVFLWSCSYMEIRRQYTLNANAKLTPLEKSGRLYSLPKTSPVCLGGNQGLQIKE